MKSMNRPKPKAPMSAQMPAKPAHASSARPSNKTVHKPPKQPEKPPVQAPKQPEKSIFDRMIAAGNQRVAENQITGYEVYVAATYVLIYTSGPSISVREQNGLDFLRRVRDPLAHEFERQLDKIAEEVKPDVEVPALKVPNDAAKTMRERMEDAER